MSDGNREEPHEPSAFNLPDGHRSESHRFPDRPLHVLLATTGSVASVKAPLIAKALLEVLNHLPDQLPMLPIPFRNLRPSADKA
jgi:hypothetical protein